MKKFAIMVLVGAGAVLVAEAVDGAVPIDNVWAKRAVKYGSAGAVVYLGHKFLGS